jgi:hypothetical protein
MAVLVTFVIGLVWWLVAWAALGMNSRVAFLVTIFLVLVAAGYRLASRRRPEA